MVEAARKEGRISYYSALELNVAERLAKAFEAKYAGIAVHVERSGAERIYQRIAQEQGSAINAVDVANSTDPAHYLDWKSKDWLAPYLPDDVARHFPADQVDPDGTYATSCGWIETIGYNTNLVKPEDAPKSFADLLDKIGVKPADINYVVLGHMHLDHAGNVGKFPSATIVYQRDEIVNAFWPKPGFGCCYITGDFAMLRNDVGQNSPNRQKVIELNGDLDLFGDGSIYIHRAAGHTPGSQLAVVRLPKSGTIVLTSDTCYLVESLDKDILPSIGLTYNPSEMLNGYAYIKRVRDMEKGQVFMAHDAEGFKAHKQAPDHYE